MRIDHPDTNRHVDHATASTALRNHAARLGCPEPVGTIGGVPAIGRTFHTLAQLIRQDGRDAVRAEGAMVLAGADRPAPSPGDLRAAPDEVRATAA